MTTTRKLLAIAMSAMLIAGQAHAENPNPYDAMIDQDRAGLYVGANSGDLERSIRSIMNTDSGDHEQLLALA